MRKTGKVLVLYSSPYFPLGGYAVQYIYAGTSKTTAIYQVVFKTTHWQSRLPLDTHAQPIVLLRKANAAIQHGYYYRYNFHNYIFLTINNVGGLFKKLVDLLAGLAALIHTIATYKPIPYYSELIGGCGIF
jgi:hypothetical protein